MELCITDTQLKSLIKNTLKTKELSEQGETVNPEPKSGTSDKQTGAAGYPEVGKWESGVTRGPANQVKVTKWSDVVGTNLKRSKANQLKEQEIGMIPGRTTQIAQTLNAPEIEKKKKIDQNFKQNYFTVKIPKTLTTKGGTDLVLPKTNPTGIATKYSLHKHPLNSSGYFKGWIGSAWEKYIPDQRQLEEILPNGTLRSFTIGDVQYTGRIKRTSDNPLLYQFLWYYDKNGDPYNPNDYISKNEVPEEYQYDDSWWAEWGQWTLTAGSIIAAVFIPGAQGLLISIGLDLVAAADLYIREDDTVGAGISVVLAFIPVIGQEILGIGKVTGVGRFSETSMNPQTVKKLSKEFATLKTEKEVVNKINSLPSNEKSFVIKLLNEDPNKIGKLIEREIYKRTNKRIVNLEQSKRWVNHLNGLVKSGKIDKKGISWWYNTLNLKRFGWDISGSLITLSVGMGIKDKQEQDKIKKLTRSTKVYTIDDISDDPYENQ